MSHVSGFKSHIRKLSKSAAFLVVGIVLGLTGSFIQTKQFDRSSIPCETSFKTDVFAAGPIVNNFDFNNYRKDADFSAFVEKHFPVGTSRSYIDSILVAQGKATSSQMLNNPAPRLTLVTYRYSFGGLGDCSMGIYFTFNHRNETVYQAAATAVSVVKYRPYSIVGGCNGI